MSSLERKHIYKVYRDGAYLGLLPNVISDFSYSQDINTAGTTIDIQVAQTLELGPEPVVPIETEAGEIITTEDLQTVTTDSAVPIVGTKDSGLIIANGNDIIVYEYSDDSPNGIPIFTGYQQSMEGTIGESDTITITAISYGKDLDDYVYGNSVYTLQTSQTSSGDWWRIGNSSEWTGGINTVLRAVFQTFNSLSYAVSKIRLSMCQGHDRLGIYPGTATITLGFYSGTPNSGTLLATATATVTSAYPTFVDTDFFLSSSITMSSGTQYYIKVESNDYANVGFADVGGYSGGEIWIYDVAGNVLKDSTGSDMKFYLYSGGLATNATFTSYDPTTMVTDTIAGYGGALVTSSSTDLTGYSLNYTFVTATALDIVKKAQELAPSDWYWYADPGTNILYFKETLTTATHKFILGRHITGLNFKSTIEYIKNVVYFTGGPTAGANLLKKYTNPTSLALDRLGMEKLSDNRIVTANVTSADSISNSFLTENDGEVFTAQSVTIPAEAYNISTINLGQTVSFEGFGSFIDNIVFQITTLEKNVDNVKLTLGKLPIKSSSYVDKIKRDLEDQQTLDNPSTPS